MNLAYATKTIHTPDCDKIAEMGAFLRGTYWDNDIWIMADSFFDKHRNGYSDNNTRRINFSVYPALFKQELKYYFAIRISENTMQLSTCIGYHYTTRIFMHFLNETYPKISSFSDVKAEKTESRWLNYLHQKGYQTLRTDYRVLIYQLTSFFSDFYDTRDEFEKDVWDCRKIPGVNIPVNTTKFKLKFTQVPPVFREMVQRYMKLRITVNSVTYACKALGGIARFLQFISETEPKWTGLEALTRRHVEEFIVFYLSGYTVKTRGVVEKLRYVMTFLQSIQQFGYPDAPLAPALSLMYKEDIPRPMELPPISERIKYVPDDVMQQLKEHLHNLTPSEYIPIVIVLIASGWRASDVLNLKYDTCLDYTEQGWYLQGDIPKVNVLAHRIPITDEVKIVIESVALIVKTKSTEANNPKHLLFNRFSGLRIGKSPYNRSISDALNRLAEDKNITDSQNNVYYFKLHALRHTKGVELINNGMKLEHVQKWMCHTSPEMTLVYAKVLDTTLRKSWEQAVKNGIFQMTDSGFIKKIDISNIEDEDIIEWEYIRYNLDAVRMPLGFCMKPKKQDCFTQLNPCLTCRNLCTTPDFLPQYEVEIQETRILIERGIAQGRKIWVEKNQHLLERYEEIVSILKTAHTWHIAGKMGREYIGEERSDAKE